MEDKVIKALGGMNLKIINKQEKIPTYDVKAIKIQHIEYYDSLCSSYDGKEITEEVIDHLLKEIPDGLDVYLSLIPEGEDDWLEVNCDGEWLAMAYRSDEGNYYSWNPQYEGVEEWAPVQGGGQSPIEKYLALTDIKMGIKVIDYFIRTGKLYPGIEWAEQLD